MAGKKITEEQEARVLAALDRRTGKKICPWCGETNWAITGSKTARLYSDFTAGGGYPSIVVVCAYCGYTILFNAIVLEIEEGDKEADDG